ncbi:MAG TPA: hypothetical protein VHR66_24800 [Gemmataceae bacterium]|jgi:hypothetical protein|nr:hypothetical protein [Gemmataceae bacterium]
MATLKGAFINLGAGLLGALPNIIVFQFNPVKVARTPTMVQPPKLNDGAGKRDAGKQFAQPSETMNFTLRIDATDQLAKGNPLAISSGILPTLSALEMLMIPKSPLSLDLISLGGGPKTHKHPPESLDTTLFFWGPFRLFPVTITSLSITETEYSPLLVPIRAEVAVNLQVLTPNQLGDKSLAIGAYKYSLGVKQVMAALNLANAVEFGVSATVSLPF